MKKFLSISLAVLMATSLVACKSNTPSASNGKVNVIFVNGGKGEIAAQWDQAAKDFMKVNPDISITTASLTVGDTLNPIDKMTASGKVVTLAMISPDQLATKYKDFGIDLTGSDWLKDTDYAVKDASGRIVGFPFAIEGMGLVYNQKVLDKVVGGTFDPWTINTRDKLKSLLNQIKASGIKFPIAYQTEVWSVGQHFGTLFFNENSDPSVTVKSAEAGTLDFASDKVWNGYFDTMDLIKSKTYNKYGDRPLGKYYDDAHVSVGNGSSAMLFNGNWAYDSLKAINGEKFGFIPVPVDNDANNPMNNKIAAGPTQTLAINQKATKEQQDAAKKFLDWIVYDEVGQDFLVNKSQVIAGFKNNPNKVTNPLGVAISEAIIAGKTMPFTNNYIPGSTWGDDVGANVQKYINKDITRADLAKVYANFFKAQK